MSIQQGYKVGPAWLEPPSGPRKGRKATMKIRKKETSDSTHDQAFLLFLALWGTL